MLKPYFFLSVLAAALTACMPSTQGASVNTISQRGSQEKFGVKRNPNPQDAYQFTVKLIDPPPNLVAVHAFAHYAVRDRECRYVTERTAGASANFQATIPVDFHRIDEHTYGGTLYFDAMLDEDYFGTGKRCRWSWSFLGMDFEPVPNISRTRYSGHVGDDEKVAEGVYRGERYITRWRYNTPPERTPLLDKHFGKDAILSSVAVNSKELFGTEAKKQLTTIVYEVRKK